MPPRETIDEEKHGRREHVRGGEAPGPQLGSLVVTVAHAWVERVLGELDRQARPVTGGWPGTVSEARAQVVSRLGMQAPPVAVTAAGLEELARRVYELARREWLTKVST